MERWEDYEVVARADNYLDLRHRTTGKILIVDVEDLKEIFDDVPSISVKPAKTRGFTQWCKEVTHGLCHLFMQFLPFGWGTRLHDWNADWVWPDYQSEVNAEQ